MNSEQAVSTRDLLALTGVALALRLAWVQWGAWRTPDGVDYLQLAQNLALHGIFSFDGVTPTAYRPPLYPAFISFFWRANEAPILAVMVLQAALGAATVALTYLIARDRFSSRVAQLAGAGMALAPMSSRYVATILTETLFTFLLTLGVLCWGRRRHVATGITLGLAALTRQALVPFILLLSLTAVARAWRSRLGTHVIAVSALLVLSPWTVRNALVFGRFVPVADDGWGQNLLLGTVEMHLGMPPWAQVAPALRAIDRDHAGAELVVREHAAMRRGMQHIWESPLRWIKARATQYPRLFIDTGEYLLGGDDQITYQQAWKTGHARVVVTKTAVALGNLVVVVLALCGLFAARRQLLALTPVWLFPAFLVVAHIPMWIEPRFGLPMMPMTFVLAAAGALAIVGQTRAERPLCVVR